MFWSILCSIILVGLSLKIHGLTLNFLSKSISKKFIYKDFIKISVALIGSHLIQITLFAYYFYYIFHAYPHLKLFYGHVSGTFLDFFYYSISCYTTLGIGDVYVSGYARIVTGMEALIGLVLIAWTATFKLSYLFKTHR